jgi:hypothetical protein
MARISSNHPMRVALLACLATVLASLSLLPPTARAGLVEQVTGQVTEVVSPVVQAVPTVPQVNATVTTTAQAVTAKVTPPPPAKAEPTSESPSKAVEDALHAVTEGAETATGASLPAAPVQASPPAIVEPEGQVADPPSVADSSESAATTAAATPTEPPAAAARTTFVPAPAENGSTGSPLPRWVAYVWPAVALTGPDLVSVGEHLGHALAQLVPDLPAGGEGGVAGVHASGGRPEAAASSSPLFARLPSEIGHAFSSVPTPIFVYLGLLALAVIAVALAVRREIASGRRSHNPW